MSNRQHRRRTLRMRLDRADVDRMVALAAHHAGCTCVPAIRVRHGEGSVTLAHDDDCPAVAARSVVAVVPLRKEHR